MDVFSIATRDDDAIFSSYVNCILLATVYAVDKGIAQERFTDMPTMTLYGNYVSCVPLRTFLSLQHLHC